MDDKIKLLLVEDEQTLADIIADTLCEKGFDVTVAYDGEAGLRAFRSARPDVVVSDIMMPCMDGFTFVAKLRREAPGVPVLFLSARSAAEDVVRGFETGGNDYLRKPFAMSELIVRVKALAGRKSAVRPRVQTLYELGRIRFDAEHRRLVCDGDVTELSAREAEILQCLCSSGGGVVPTKTLLMDIWGDDSFFNARSLHVFITRLRHRLAADPSVQLVNVRGVGYRLLLDRGLPAFGAQ